MHAWVLPLHICLAVSLVATVATTAIVLRHTTQRGRLKLLRFAAVVPKYAHAQFTPQLSPWSAPASSSSVGLAKVRPGGMGRTKTIASIAGSSEYIGTCGFVERPLAERVILVTGATDGIGRHTATRLAQEGATVLVHGRSEERVATVVGELMPIAAAAGGAVRGFTADLSRMDEVRRLANEVDESCGPAGLDALDNNAGVFEETLSRTDDSMEMTFAVNCAAPFLLTSLLLPTLTRAPSARVVVVSSISQGYSAGLSDLNFRAENGRAWSSHRSYSLSKLVDAMIAVEMAQRYGRRGLSFSTLDPGTVNTKMLLAGWGRCGIDVGSANNQFQLLTDEILSPASEANSANGEYFVGSRRSRCDNVVYDVDARRDLWDELVALTGAEWPELTST